MAGLSHLKRLIQQTFFPGTFIRRKYEAFRALLECDRVCHEKMARLQELHHEGKPWDHFALCRHYDRLVRSLGGMVDQLTAMNPRAYAGLPAVLRQIDQSIRGSIFEESPQDDSPPHVLFLDDPLSTDARRTGGKASNLAIAARDGSMTVPEGFVVTTAAFRHVLSQNELLPPIAELLSRLDVSSGTSIEETSHALQSLIFHAVIPADIESAMTAALERAFQDRLSETFLAVRSSCVGEDSNLSFAGQYASVLGVPATNLLDAYKKVLASKYSPQALVYRIGHGLSDTQTPMAVLVLEMIDARAGGVLYTQDPLSGESDKMMLYAVRGAGEHLVSGTMAPDGLVFSKKLSENCRSVQKIVDRVDNMDMMDEMDRGKNAGCISLLSTRLATSPANHIISIQAPRYLESRSQAGYWERENFQTASKTRDEAVLDGLESSGTFRKGLEADGGGDFSKTFPGEFTDFPLDPSTALRIASWGMRLESLFQGAQDIEWCVDREGEVFLLQSRPLGASSGKMFSGTHACAEGPWERSGEQGFSLGEAVEDPAHRVILSGGETASPGVAGGWVLKPADFLDDADTAEGFVLVVETSSPVLARFMPRAKAVIAQIGSVAGHLSSVARERGVPMLVNVEHALQKLRAGDVITVDAGGKTVYEGTIELARPPCDAPAPLEGSPFRSRLKALLDRVSPLNLIDPQSPRFQFENCRTLHDIVRFTHEKAVREMFVLAGEGAGRVRGARKLVTDVPISLYVLDMDGGPALGEDAKTLTLDQVHCDPVKSLWTGLTHPTVEWTSDRLHVDWEELDRISGGIFAKESQLLSSFAIVSRDYLNVNIRFGYHFVLLDAFCGEEPRENHITLQFEGGGGSYEGRLLRIQFLGRILVRHGFDVKSRGDMIHANLRYMPAGKLLRKLEMVGRLLGVTRLMDVRLHDDTQVENMVADFLDMDEHE